MLIQEIMTKTLETIPPTATLRDAAQKMAFADIGALPVGINGKPHGVVTDRDIVVRGVAKGANPDETPVNEVMTSTLHTISDDEDVDEAMRKMRELQVRRLLVTDKGSRMCGIISIGDVAFRADQPAKCGKALEGISSPV